MKISTVQRTLRVLLVQYSLSGETKTASHEFVKGLEAGLDHEVFQAVDVVEQRIKPVHSFPFPWTVWSFFDVMPETVNSSVRRKKEHPEYTIVAKPEPELLAATTSFDLVVLGWQTWYLAPSLPVRLAVDHPDYQKLFRKAPMLLLGTHRNMWHRAHRTLHRELKEAGSTVLGRIDFIQSSPYLASLAKTLRWQLQGKTMGPSGATGAKERAFVEGRDFAKLYYCAKDDQASPALPEYYESGAPYRLAMAVAEDIWFPCKWTLSLLMGKFPPGSIERKVLTAIYIPFLLTAIIFALAPGLLIASTAENLFPMMRRRTMSDGQT